MELGHQALDDTGAWHQRRRLLGASFVLSFVLAMTLFRDRSISNLLRFLLDVPGLEGVPPRLPTQEAMIHARKRLGLAPVRSLFERQAAEVHPPATFRGLRVWALDGVRLTMPDTPANEAAFGRTEGSRGRAAYPHALAVCLVDVHGRRVREAWIGRHDASERGGIAPALRHLDGGDLVIKDRGFPSVEVFKQFQQAGVHFLARISSKWKPRYLAMLGPGEWLAEVKARVPIPPEKREPGGRKTRTIRAKVRIVEYRIGRGKPIRLATDLTPDEATALELALLYERRWECELSFDEQKDHLMVVHHARARTIFRSKTPEGVLQEAYGMLVTYNAIRTLMVEAAEVGGTEPLNLSFRSTVLLLRDWLPVIRSAHEDEMPRLREALVQRIASLVNDRPRRDRSYDRVVKRKMSNFPLKREGHRQCPGVRESDLTLVCRP